MPLITKINLNTHIKVKLTDVGREILKHEHEMMGLKLPKLRHDEFVLDVDDDGWYRRTVVDIFSTFGPYLNECQPAINPFGPEIKIEQSSFVPSTENIEDSRARLENAEASIRMDQARQQGVIDDERREKVDYKVLLGKYIKIVANEEGVDFVPDEHNENGDLTPEEHECLLEAAGRGRVKT